MNSIGAMRRILSESACHSGLCKWATRLIASGTDGLADFDITQTHSPLIGYEPQSTGLPVSGSTLRSQLTYGPDRELPGMRGAPSNRAGSLASDNKKQRMVSTQSDSQRLRELGDSLRSRSSLNVDVPIPFPHDAALPQTHFVHSVGFVLVAAISQIIDQEHA